MDKSKLSFDAELLSVYKLFKNDAYVIPAYQRDYAWDTEQWTQLWEDLSGYQESNAEDHFLGPLIVTPNEIREKLGLPQIDGGDDMIELTSRQAADANANTRQNRTRDAERTANQSDGEATTTGRNPQGEGRSTQ